MYIKAIDPLFIANCTAKVENRVRSCAQYLVRAVQTFQSGERGWGEGVSEVSETWLLSVTKWIFGQPLGLQSGKQKASQGEKFLSC